MSYPRYAATSHYASCPAATGETRSNPDPCGTYPDSAHRCRRERDLDPHLRHVCLCGHEWICLASASLDEPAVIAAMHPPRHAA